MISGQTFANCCDMIIDPRYGTQGIDQSKLHSAKTIFINGDIFEQIIPFIITCKQVPSLVLHNSDRFFDRIKLEAVKPYIEKIYAINCDFGHPKIVNIPLGVSDKSDIWKKEGTPEKTILCYVNFGLYENTNELKFANVKYARDACKNYFSKTGFATLKNNLTMDEFMKDMSLSRFIICPPGFGIDTHRFYEAVWMGATPIVLSSSLDDMYRKFGALIVDNWEDVTEQLLKEFKKGKIDRSIFQSQKWIR